MKTGCNLYFFAVPNYFFKFLLNCYHNLFKPAFFILSELNNFVLFYVNAVLAFVQLFYAFERIDFISVIIARANKALTVAFNS